MSNYKDLKHKNLVDKGTEGTTVASGTTGQRGSGTGQWRYNSTTGKFEGRGASDFIVLEVTPTVSSIDDTEVDSAGGGNQTIVITGTNFGAGATASFIGTSASFNAATTTVDSATQITAVAPKASFLNAQEPYGVRVTSAGGLAGTLTSAINVDNAPTWTTGSGSLGSITDFTTGTHATLVASDAEGDTVAYTETGATNLSGAGLALNSSTGVISGDPTNVGASTTVSFTGRATAGAKTADRAFSITITPALDGTSSARANTSASAIKTLTSTTTDGYYWIQASGMASPKQLWCDMNTDGGGYMRFWWFNDLEQGGGVGASWQSGTKFGTADISTITHTQDYGYGRIPSGVTPTKLMVKGTSAQQTSTSPPSYMIWTFNGSNATSAAMLASMQSGTTCSFTDRGEFNPSSGNMDSNLAHFQSSGQCDFWGYGTSIFGGSESTFDLNDDAGRDNTCFAAGYDGAASGTDFGQVSGSGIANATGRYLILYWK